MVGMPAALWGLSSSSPSEGPMSLFQENPTGGAVVSKSRSPAIRHGQSGQIMGPILVSIMGTIIAVKSAWRA